MAILKNVWKLASISALAGFVLFGGMLSCDDVGLGEAVDTEAPKLEISYPPASAAVRGEFVLAGTWNDDVGVTNIVLTITNNTTKETFPANDVTLGDGNSWQVRVNNYDAGNSSYYNGWQLPDGKYELSVEAYDDAGHKSGQSSRTIEVDNTAPVVILTNPGTTDKNQATEYGSTFKVSGTIADDHTIAKMAVNIYDENHNLINTESYVETSVPTAGGTSVTLLQFDAVGTDELSTRYRQVYGNDINAGTQYYYCSISVTDSAQEYTNPAESTNTSSGNSTSTFYLNGDVYELLLSEKKGKGLSAADLMNILNGTYSGNKVSRAATGDNTVSSVLAILKEKAIDTAKKQLAFSLNPLVNPHYTVSGYQLNKKEGEASEYTSSAAVASQPITIIVSMGLDGTQLKPSTFKAYLKDFGTNADALYNKTTGIITDTVSEFRNLTTAQLAEAAQNDDSVVLFDEVTGISDTTLVDTYQWSLTLPNVVSPGHYYVIALGGADADDNELRPTDVYGFMATTSGIPPKVRVEDNLKQYWNVFNDIVVSGTVSSSDTNIAGAFVYYTVTAHDPVTDTYTLYPTGYTNATDGYKITPTATTEHAGTWSISLKDKISAPAGQTNKEYTLTIYAIDEEGSQSDDQTAVVFFDNTPPVLRYDGTELANNAKITNTSANYTKNGDAYEFRFAGTISDKNGSGTDTLSYSLDGTNWTDSSDYAGATSERSVTVFLPVGQTSSTQIAFKLTDKAGNETAVITAPTNTTVSAYTGLTFDYDNPVLTPGTDSIDTVINKDETLTILGTITDTLLLPSSAVASSDTATTGYGVEIVGKNGGVAKNIASYVTLTRISDTKVTYKLQITPEQTAGGSLDGVWEFTINAKDAAGLSATEKKYTVTIDATAPVVGTPVVTQNSTALTDSFFASATPLLLTAAVTNETSVTSVEYLLVDGMQTTLPSDLTTAFAGGKATWTAMAANTSTGGTGVTGTATISEFIGKPDGLYTIFVRATDAAGNETVTPARITVHADGTEPTLTETDGVDAYTGVTNNQFVLSGEVYDGSKGESGTITDNYLASVTSTGELTTGSGTVASVVHNSTAHTWSITQTVPNDTNSYTYKYTITAKDKAGNTKVITKSVSIDRDAPTIAVTSLNGNTFAADSTKLTVNSQSCRFEGTVDDTLSGVKSLTAYLTDKDNKVLSEFKTNAEDTTATSPKDIAFGEGTKTWSTSFALDADGEYTLYLTATDKAGNTETITKQFATDFAAPVSTISASSGTLLKSDGTTMATADWAWDTNTTYITKDAFTLSGTVTDGFTFDVADIVLSVNNETVSFTNTSATGEVSSMTWTYAQSADSNGTYVYKLTLKDKAGNTDSKTFSVLLDTTAPIVTIKNPVENANETATKVKIEGSVSDAGSGVKSVSYVVKNTTDTTKADVTGTATVNGGNWSAEVEGLSDGTLSLTVTAKDYLDQSTTTDMRMFFRDSTAPVFTTNPAVQTSVSKTETDGKKWYNSSVLAVTAVAKDPDSGINSVTYKVGSDGATAVMSLADTATTNEKKAEASSVVCNEGENEITVTATNGVSLTKAEKVTVYVDTQRPAFGDTITVSNTSTASGVTDSNVDVSFAGTITDAQGLAEDGGFVITATKQTESGTTTYTAAHLADIITTNTNPATKTALSAAPWKFTLPAANNDGYWTFTITATDRAGNTMATTASVRIDTVSPVWNATTTSKTLVGGKAWQALTTSGSETINPNWFKETTLTFVDYLKESSVGSGIASVEYTVTGGTTQTATPQTTTTNKARGDDCRINIEIGNLTNGGTVEFVAVDAAGNRSAARTFAIQLDDEEPTFALEKLLRNDVEEDVDGQVLSNAAVPLTIYATTQDQTGKSGVDYTVAPVVAKIVGTSETFEVTAAYETDSDDAYTGEFKIALTAAQLQKCKNGITTINVTIKDVAGNSHTDTLTTLQIDKIAPTALITSPASARVNKTITIEGTASDTTSFSNATLWYRHSPTALTLNDAAVKSDDGWTQFATTTDNVANMDSDKHLIVSDNAWKYVLNTNTATFNQTGTDSYLYVRVKAVDSAGNITTVKKDYVINQDDDRPVVKVSNLAKLTKGTGASATTEYVLKYGTNAQITGTVTDDDATSDTVVAKLYVQKENFTTATLAGWSEDSTASTSTVKVWKHATYGTVELTLSSGDWTYTPATADQVDGTKTMYFYVEDSKGTTFSAAATDSLARPYWQFKTDTKEDTSAGVAYKVDGTSPKILSAKVYAYEDAAATKPYYVDDDGKDVGITVGTAAVLGGVKARYAKFVITASDANGIDSLGLTISKSDESKVITASSATAADTTSFEAVTITTTDGTIPGATWETAVLDLGASTGTAGTDRFSTGEVTLAIEATDGSDLPGNGSFSFMIDYDAPKLTSISPSSSVEQIGSVAISGYATDVGTAGVADIKYAIPTASGTVTYGGNLAATATAAAWVFNLNGNTTTGNPTLLTAVDDYKNNATAKATYLADGDTEQKTDIWNIPIYFQLSDTLGNTQNYTVDNSPAGYTGYFVRYNPNADMPYTTITYPTESDYDTNSTYVTLSGNIRVAGSVSIESPEVSVAAVYLQVGKVTETKDADGNITGKTIDWKSGSAWTEGASGITADELTAYDVSAVAADNLGFTEVKNAKASDGVDWWGVKATSKGASWNITLNKNNGLNAADNGTNSIVIRACAVNSSGKMGNWSAPTYIHVDNAAPKMTYTLQQFASAPTSATISAYTAEQDYEPDMYLRNASDNWWLAVTVYDESGINSVTTSSTTATSANTVQQIAIGKTMPGGGTSSNDNYKVFIPISAETGASSYSITATDYDESGAHTTRMTFTINVDNTAPTVEALTDNAGNAIAMTKQRNSNYVVTFNTIATDTGSGFSRLAYYFKRGSSVELPVPSKQTGTNEWKPAKETRLVSESLTASGDDAGLYGVTVTGGTVALAADKTTGTFTASDVAAQITEGVIRKGSLLRIGEVYYDITDATGTTVTFSTEGAASPTVGSGKSAFFAAVFVVNAGANEGSGGWNNGVQTISSDDGDGMLEFAERSGASYNINASFYSDELDDGELTLVCASFDKVGNVQQSETKLMLANNTPRLSKVYLATDLNGDSSFTENEKGSSTEGTYYSALTSDGKAQRVVTLNATAAETADTGIRMVNKLGLAFEFVSGYDTNGTKTANEGYGSGTGTLGYKLNVGSAALTTPTTGTTMDGTVGTASNFTDSTIKTLAGVELAKDLFTSGTTYGTYTDWEDTDEKRDVLNYITLTLWDNTNGKQGTDDTIATEKEGITYYESFGAQYTVLNIPLRMDLVDGIKPVPKINTPSTTYETTTTDGETETITLAGHVDASETLLTKTFSGTAPTNNGGFEAAEFDTDDKISGTVVFEGTVTDEQRITSLTLNSDKTLTSKAMSGVQVAKFENGVLVTTAAAADSSSTWQFSILNTTAEEQFKVPGVDDALPNGGHIVKWRLILNSAIVQNIAQSDVTFTLTANDGGSNTQASTRKVDIVPYITEIISDTATDAVAKGSGKLYRSRYGEYSVYKGDILTVYGYNLPDSAPSSATATSDNYIKIGDKTVLATTNNTNTRFTFTVPQYSGELYVKVNGMVNLNSFNNNNNATNKEVRTTNAYTGEAETYYFDNRYIRVWDIDHSFKDADSDAHKPIMAADKKGNLFGAWTRMGDGQVIMQRGANNSSTRVLQHYDQPAEYVAIGIDRSADNGNISVLNFNENVGDGGIMSDNGFSAVSNTGGAWGISIANDIAVTEESVYSASAKKNIPVTTIANNPTTILDSNWGTSGYSLSSYAMLRDVSKFSTPRTARSGENMHFVYYDSKDQSLRYTYVKSNSHSDNYDRNANFTTMSWVLIDGTVSGYDRLHDYTKDTASKDYVALGDVLATQNNYATSEPDSDSYGDYIENRSLYVLLSNKAESREKVGIGITYTTSNGTRRILVLDNVYWVNGTNQARRIYMPKDKLDEAYEVIHDDTAYKDKKLTIYKGAKNNIADSTAVPQADSAGKFASLDLTKDGAPVIAYYDSTHGQLRVASSASTSGGDPSSTLSGTSLASNWTRQIVSYNGKNIEGGQHCALKVDNNGNLHIIYRGKDNSLYYISSKSGSAGGTYEFNEPILIDDNTTGTWGTISLRNGTTPIVAYLNSEESEEGVKVAILRDVDVGAEKASATATATSTFDAMIMPLASGRNTVGENLVCVEANSGSWDSEEAGVSTKYCEAAVSYQSNRLDLSFLKSEEK